MKNIAAKPVRMCITIRPLLLPSGLPRSLLHQPPVKKAEKY